MSNAVETIIKAQQLAVKIRPKVGGFPYLAEILRKAGVIRNIWNLPSCQSIYLTQQGSVVSQSTPLVSATVDVPPFNSEALIKALRADQTGQSSFPEFLKAAWEAGVVNYVVDFEKRTVVYYGIQEESYSEDYPLVAVE